MKTLKFFVTIISISIFSLITKGQSCTNCNGGTVTATINASGLGTNPISTGNSSLAGGHTSTASGDYSIAFGYQSKATGSNSNAFGAMVESNHTNSTVIGRHLKTMASETFILGTGIGPNQYLVNSTPSSLMVGFNSQYPTFFVGPSALNKTGKVAIGNMTNPTAKFHIYSDENEAAEIKLEPRATGVKQYAQIYFGTHTIRAGNSENMVFTTPAGRNFAFVTGNVGINTTAPTQKLDIDGNIRLRNNAIIGTWSNNSLTFNTNSSARMTIAADGNVAIGNNTDPQARLHIKAEGTQDAGILLEASGTGKSAGIFFTKSAVNIGTLDKDQPIAFFTAGTDLKMKITPEGNVGIGVTSPLYKLHVAGNAKFDNQVVIDAGGLYVNGEVKAKKFHASISPFPDFVFEPGYKLLSINEVESFINQNGHLPGVPNAAQVEQNGIELGEMNALLLQKIEELTLYIIAQDKEMKELKAIVETLK